MAHFNIQHEARDGLILNQRFFETLSAQETHNLEGHFCITENGFIQMTGQYLAGKQHGQHVVFQEKGIAALLHFDQGVLHGPMLTFSETGDLTTQTHYVKGKKEGLYRVFYPSNQIAIEGMYAQDQQQGWWITFTPEGVEQERTYYHQGVACSSECLSPSL